LVRPIAAEALASELVERVDAQSSPWVRLAIDGAPSTQPCSLAEALVHPLRVRGRAVQIVDEFDYLRPASQRYEWGRTNPESFYLNWFDTEALRREVLEPTGPGGSGLVLPTRWDPVSDRATRVERVALPAGGVVVLCGPFLLGGGLPVDVTVHLWQSAAALTRRTPAADVWTLPAFRRYETEVAAHTWADVVVRMDDLRHPAIVDHW
jgi:hypothetical protein